MSTLEELRCASSIIFNEPDEAVFTNAGTNQLLFLNDWMERIGQKRTIKPLVNQLFFEEQDFFKNRTKTPHTLTWEQTVAVLYMGIGYEEVEVGQLKQPIFTRPFYMPDDPIPDPVEINTIVILHFPKEASLPSVFSVSQNGDIHFHGFQY